MCSRLVVIHASWDSLSGHCGKFLSNSDSGSHGWQASSTAFFNGSLDLSHLRTLRVQDISHMDPLVLGIQDLRTLEELTLECSAWVGFLHRSHLRLFLTPLKSQLLPRERWGSFTCDLPSLRTINIQTGNYFIGEVSFQRLCELFQCITAHSLDLEVIYLGSSPPRLNPPFSGECLVQGIIDRNKHSLCSLSVSAAYLPAHVLIQLVTECLSLDELHISGNRSDLVYIHFSFFHSIFFVVTQFI